MCEKVKKTGIHTIGACPYHKTVDHIHSQSLTV